MKTSEALKLVKGRVAVDGHDRRKSSFLCLGASRARMDGDISSDMEEAIHYHIDQLLQGEETLECWLKIYHGVEYDTHMYGSPRNIAHRNKMQATRHAWIDSMIAEFQAKGD